MAIACRVLWLEANSRMPARTFSVCIFVLRYIADDNFFMIQHSIFVKKEQEKMLNIECENQSVAFWFGEG